MVGPQRFYPPYTNGLVVHATLKYHLNEKMDDTERKKILVVINNIRYNAYCLVTTFNSRFIHAQSLLFEMNSTFCPSWSEEGFKKWVYWFNPLFKEIPVDRFFSFFDFFTVSILYKRNNTWGRFIYKKCFLAVGPLRGGEGG